MTFELVLLPLMNDPSSPMNGDTSGNSGPDTPAMPFASSTVMPVSAITTAITTIVVTLRVELRLCLYVSLTASSATPLRHQPVAA